MGREQVKNGSKVTDFKLQSGQDTNDLNYPHIKSTTML